MDMLAVDKSAAELSDGVICNTFHCGHKDNCRRAIIHHKLSQADVSRLDLMVRANDLTENCEHFIAYPDFLKVSPKS